MAEIAFPRRIESALRQSASGFRGMTFGKFIAWLLLISISVLFIIPLVWMISTSLKEPSDLFGMRWIPTRLV